MVIAHHRLCVAVLIQAHVSLFNLIADVNLGDDITHFLAALHEICLSIHLEKAGVRDIKLR